MTGGIRIAFGGGGEADDERAVLDLFGSWVGDGRLLYVPIAMGPPYSACLEWVTAALAPSGIANIAMATSSEQVVSELPRSDAVFIGGGSTYSLRHALRANEADRLLRRSAEDGCPVYGGSAGAILLGRDIDTSRHADPNEVGLTDTSGLDLALGYSIWCHYVPSDDPRIRRHVSETGHAVIAISERSGLARIGGGIRVIGDGPARLYGPGGSRRLKTGDPVPAIVVPDPYPRGCRSARRDDLEAMREVQRAANQMFADVGMTTVAQAETSPIHVFARYQAAARAWVITDDDDVPVGYVLTDVVGDFAHVTDIAVHPAFQRRGIGGKLLEHAAGWGRARGSTRLTLTTFRDVPWNGPYYQRRGFRELRDDELTPTLCDKFDEETRIIIETTGFGRSSRVCMGRDLHETD